MRQIIFDTETTGFDTKKERIVEIGAVEMVNGFVTDKIFHAYINPEKEVPIEAFKVHNLSYEFLKDKPVFSEVAAELLEFFGESVLIAHNANFDVGFINAELRKIKKPILKNKVIDSLSIARQKFPGASNSLDALCKRFKISLDEREKAGHGALLDSYLLAKVYIELTGGKQATLLQATKETTSSQKKKFAKIDNSQLIKIPDQSKNQDFLTRLKEIENNIWK